MPDEQKIEDTAVVPEPVNEPEIEPQVSESETTPEVIEPAPEVTETEAEIAPEIPENATGEAVAEPAEPTPEPETAQMGGIEALPEDPVEIPETENEGAGATPNQDKSGTGQAAEAPEEPEPTPAKADEKQQTPNAERDEKPTKKESSIKEKLKLLRQMAHATIALRREKKYVKIMELFAKQTAITNDDVQGLLRVSDATATRYLTELEKRDKLKQVGTTGRGVSYVKQ